MGKKLTRRLRGQAMLTPIGGTSICDDEWRYYHLDSPDESLFREDQKLKMACRYKRRVAEPVEKICFASALELPKSGERRTPTGCA